jgi:signal transduction histidine kinase
MPRRPAKKSLNTDVFFRHMVGNMRNGVLAITRDGRVVLVNEEACRLFHLPPPNMLVGRPYADVLADHPDIVRVLGGAFGMAALPNRAELRLSSTDMVIGYTLSLVRQEDGEPVGAALFFKDLTQVEQQEERERLRDRLAAVGEMAAVMAHEIKNPLAGIEVMAGLLRRKTKDNADAQALVGEIINEAKLANSIVQEVLSFVRPVKVQSFPTSVADALSSALTLADNEAQRGETVIKVDVPTDLPPVGGDYHQLTQVFSNLLINAYQALDGKGRIDVTARLATTPAEGALLPDGLKPVDTVIVEIADNGPGVPANVAEKIFNPFFTTKPKGSGLGLAVVRKIVDAHDGRIDMSTAEGRGTKFRVTLRVGPQAPAAAHP